MVVGELHHRLVEAYAPPSVLVNAELDVVHVSEHAGRYLIVPGGEPCRNLIRLAHEDLRVDLRAAIDAAREPGRREDARRVRATLNGEEHLIELRVRVVDAPDDARGMLLVFFDEKEDVGRAQNILQNLMTSLDIGVVFLDRRMHLERFTPRAQDLFEIAAGDIGRPLAHLTHRLDVDDLTASAVRVLETLRTVEREVRSTDGKQYLARIHPYRSLEDRIDGVVLTFLDVTDLKRAEHALRTREAVLQLAERAAEAGMWELDPVHGLHMSPECLRLHGLELAPPRLGVEEWMQRLHRGDRDRVRTALRRAVDGDEDLDVEYRIQHGSKGVRWLWATGRTLADEDGRARAIGGITIDVTGRRRTEAALRASEERFRLALRTAPVVMLNQDRDLRYTWGHMLGGAVEFIGKTDHELFSKAEADQLAELKRDVMQSGVGRRGEIALTVSGTVHYYDYNVEPIRQDGEVVGASSAAVDVTASKLSELAMRDAGRRKDELLATLAHELRNPLAPLVAALDMQQLAEGDLGRIESARVLAERQVATIIRLVDDLLDFTRTHRPAQAAAARLTVSEPPRVLVVDDNQDVTEAVSDLLRMMGHETECASCGAAALEQFDVFAPHVVLLDIGLPDMDGFEVARQLRQRPRGKDVTIVAVTGWGGTEDLARTAAEAGFDHHLVKPAGLVALREILGDLDRRA
jgi:CheY-like chemotaxis protein